MHYKSSKLIFLLFLICIVTFWSCKTTGEIVSEKSSSISGIELFSGNTENKKATWHCIKIDLDNPQIDIELIPSSTDVNLYSVKKIAKQAGAIAAINTTPFRNELDNSLVGVTKIGGTEITPPVQNYAALGFTQRPLRAHILSSQSPNELEKYPAAAGGFYVILNKGEILQFSNIKRSRAAAGISDDGRYLYLFATTPRFSLKDYDGMTYPETATLLKTLGCSDALQFDGGHSTSLYFNGKELEKPLFQRKVPALLIIK